MKKREILYGIFTEECGEKHFTKIIGTREDCASWVAQMIEREKKIMNNINIYSIERLQKL